MNPTTIEIFGSLYFAFAVLHTFLSGKILKFSLRYAKDSIAYCIFHLLGEIEVVFALWGALLMLTYIFAVGWSEALHYQESLSFVEPFFVFVIMIVCSTRPILTIARHVIQFVSSNGQKVFCAPAVVSDLFVVLALGSLSGSFITEPAAMTVTAFLLNSMLGESSKKLLYALLAVLFVNVSIGGALTPFAAPPILMVAKTWQWDFSYVFGAFGWKCILAVLLNSFLLLVIFRKQFLQNCLTLQQVVTQNSKAPLPFWIILSHLLFLLGLVITSHYQNAFLAIFILFLGLYSVTFRHQDSLRLKESLLVAVFLGGIIVFGTFQKWWLTPLLMQMTDGVLFGTSVGLTAITDNAALTYLGAQVPGLSAASKYALVAGAICGGGLTIVANAPNAAGFSILGARFKDGMNPILLFVAALVPTAVAIGCLWGF